MKKHWIIIIGLLVIATSVAAFCIIRHDRQVSLVGSLFWIKPFEKRSSNTTPILKGTSVFKDSNSGVSFSYPSYLVVQEEYAQPFEGSLGWCPVYRHITLRNPNAQPVELEAGSPQQPWIDIMIRKADCTNAALQNETPNQLSLKQILPTYTITDPMKSALVALVPARGDLPNGPGQPPVWVDLCAQPVSITASNKIIVSNKKCLLDGGMILLPGQLIPQQFFITKKLVPVNQNMLVEVTFGNILFTEALVNNIIDTISINLTTIAPSGNYQ